MRIAFWLTTDRRFEAKEIDRTPFGGCEIEALHLARELTRIYKMPCYIFANVVQPVGIQGHAFFFRYEDLPRIVEHKDFDVLIVVRADARVLNPRYSDKYFGNGRPDKIILWSGDSYDQRNNEMMHDHWSLANIDLVVLKGYWQMQTWLENFRRLEEGRVTVIRKGIDVSSLCESPSTAIAPRFIYASVAFRGLHRFIDIWPRIKERIPDATLDCFPKTTLYDGTLPQDQYEQIYKQLAALPGVTVNDPLPQKEFLKILPTYYAMLYPNCGFEETVCGVALEAMASGVPVITSAVAGLVETINAGGSILIEGDPASKDYERKFVEAVCDLWGNSLRREMLSITGFHSITNSHNIKTTAEIWKRTIDEAAQGRALQEDGGAEIGHQSAASYL
jgi:glycosyltransferase involved in cell wall biosynthesis